MTLKGLAITLVKFRTQEEAENFVNPCTMDSLKDSVTKTAWNLFQQVEGIMYDGYDHGYPEEPHYGELDYSTIWLVDNRTKRIVEHLSRIHGFSEWSAISYFCKHYFKRGHKASDFTIVFLRLRDENKHRKVGCTNGIPWYEFSE